MPSIRITLNEQQQQVLKELLEEVLNGYYSDPNIEKVSDFNKRFELRMEKINLESILSKLP